MTVDYYQILGVGKDATDEQIAAAYRKKALECHPDRNKSPDAAEQFKKVAQAFEVLGNKEKRANYDRFGTHQPFRNSPFNNSSTTGSAADFFETFFGMGNRPSGGRDRGRDARVKVTISFEEAIRGCTKQVKIKLEEKCTACERGYKSWKKCEACGGTGEKIIQSSPWTLKMDCPTCGGRGNIPGDSCDKCQGRGFTAGSEESVSVDLPAGIDNGHQIRIPGKGQTGITGHRGTLFVEVNVEPHPFWSRSRADIICRVPVTYTQLLLGDTITIPTIKGDTQIKIPSGTAPEKRLRLRGLGAPDLTMPGRVGDMYVALQLEFPAIPGEEYHKLLSELKRLEQEHPTEFMKKFQNR
jgi:molecular chaperone DnaJ